MDEFNKLVGSTSPRRKPMKKVNSEPSVAPPDKKLLPQKKGFTFDGLVEHMVSEESDNLHGIISEFLITYRNLCTPGEFVDALTEHCNQSSEERIHLRTFIILRTWADKYSHDFQQAKKEIIEKLQKWEEVVTDPKLKKMINDFVNRIVKPPRNTLFSPNFYMEAPKPWVPLNPQRIEFLEIPSLEIARQLTLLEETLWKGVQTWECFGLGWTKPETSKEKAPNISKFIIWFNKISVWVKTEVLITQNLKRRARVLQKFLSIAQQCLQLNNFNAALEISSALNSGPLRRLTRTFKELKDCQVLQTISEFQEKNFRKLRDLLPSIKPPCIPYLGMYLTDLVFIEEGNKDKTEEGLINWNKYHKYAGTIMQIQHFQQEKYCLTQVPAVREFLMDRIEKVHKEIGHKTQNDIDDIHYELSQIVEPKLHASSHRPTGIDTTNLLMSLRRSESSTDPVSFGPTLETLPSFETSEVPIDLSNPPLIYSRFKYIFYYDGPVIQPEIHSIVSENELPKTDTLNVPLHGSKSSSTPMFSLPKLNSNINFGKIRNPMKNENDEVVTPVHIPLHTPPQPGLILFPPDICYSLNKDYKNFQTTLKLMDGHDYLFDFEEKTFYQNNKTPKRTLHVYKRLKKWYWRDDDGTLKPYKFSDILEFSNMLKQKNYVTSFNIGKHSYEMDLNRKVQKNITFGTEREMLTEKEFLKLYHLDQKVEFEKAEGVQLVPLQQEDQEYEKVKKIFHIHMPALRKASMVESTLKKGKHFPISIKIFKIMNYELRQRWLTELDKYKEKQYGELEIDLVRYLFYTSTSETIDDIVAGKGWVINSPGEDSCVFSTDASYFSKLKPTTTTSSNLFNFTSLPKRTILSEVIVGDEYYCYFEEAAKGFPFHKCPSTTTLITLLEETWLWYLTDSVRACPLYLIEWN